MELHIKDRIYFPQLLPQQGSFMEFNTKRTILKKVTISDNDRTEYNIQEDKENGRVTWDSNKDFSQQTRWRCFARVVNSSPKRTLQHQTIFGHW